MQPYPSVETNPELLPSYAVQVMIRGIKFIARIAGGIAPLSNTNWSAASQLAKCHSVSSLPLTAPIIRTWTKHNAITTDNSSPLVTPPPWWVASWIRSLSNSRQSMSIARQWEQVASNPTSLRTGTSATDTSPWPCRLTAWETKPWTSEPTSSHLTFALWLSLKRSGARSELPCLPLLVSAGLMARIQMQTIIWMHTTHC